MQRCRAIRLQHAHLLFVGEYVAVCMLRAIHGLIPEVPFLLADWHAAYCLSWLHTHIHKGNQQQVDYSLHSALWLYSAGMWWLLLQTTTAAAAAAADPGDVAAIRFWGLQVDVWCAPGGQWPPLVPHPRAWWWCCLQRVSRCHGLAAHKLLKRLCSPVGTLHARVCFVCRVSPDGHCCCRLPRGKQGLWQLCCGCRICEAGSCKVSLRCHAEHGTMGVRGCWLLALSATVAGG